jgi:dTDP-glucose 4,6-dehydratase
VSKTESNKKILVTGGLGVVGKPLVDELRDRGYDVWINDLMHYHDNKYLRVDIGSFRQVKWIFENYDFDFVYHLAAEFGRMNGEHFYENLWKTNVVGTKNILKIQEKKDFKLIFSSSSEIYGNYDGVMKEDVPMITPIRQLNDYAISKWVNELQIMNSMERCNTETVRVRLFNTYGPGEYYSNYRSVICLFVYRALHNMPYTVYSKHHRTSSYIDDTVRTLANIVDNFNSGEVYNISGDEYHDIKKVSDIVLNYLGKDDSLVIYKEVEEGNTINKKAVNSKAKRDLGHKITINLKEGIKRTIEWQKKVYGK